MGHGAFRNLRQLGTHVMSRQVSPSCSSACSVPVCQSNVATWPFFPTTAICLAFRAYEESR